MSAYVQLLLAQLRLFIRNRQVMFWSLAFPLFFMIMLGSFLGSDTKITARATVIDEDQTSASQTFTQALEDKGFMKITRTTDLDKSLNELKHGDQQLVLVIPKGYGETLTTGAKQGTPAQVVAYYDQTNLNNSNVALTVVNQVADGVSKQLTGYQAVVGIQQEGVQSLNLKYIDFLVPGIVGMMIMSNNLNGVAGQIASWRERGILRRMQSTPLNASSFVAAQITARLLINGLQAVIVLLVGSLVFGTQVNGSWLLLLSFVILGTLAFMSIGFIIASLAKTPESAGPIAGFISFPMLFLGGVFFPIQNMPTWLQPAVKILPISHLTTALRQVMNVGAGLGELWPQFAILAGWMIVAFLISSKTFKWE